MTTQRQRFAEYFLQGTQDGADAGRAAEYKLADQRRGEAAPRADGGALRDQSGGGAGAGHPREGPSREDQPGAEPVTARDIARLAAEGITHVLDLREEHEWTGPKRFGAKAVEALERFGLKRHALVIRDQSAPTPADLDAACAYLNEVLADPTARVYVHCRAGMERTAAVLIAFHACEHNTTFDEALSVLRERRPILRPMSHQERAVREWLRHRQSGR